MSRTPSFIRTRGDARAVLAAHRSHGRAPHFGCPYCVRDGARIHTSR
jgi:hypothetical protein